MLWRLQKDPKVKGRNPSEVTQDDFVAGMGNMGWVCEILAYYRVREMELCTRTWIIGLRETDLTLNIALRFSLQNHIFHAVMWCNGVKWLYCDKLDSTLTLHLTSNFAVRRWHHPLLHGSWPQLLLGPKLGPLSSHCCFCLLLWCMHTSLFAVMSACSLLLFEMVYTFDVYEAGGWLICCTFPFAII